MNGTTRIAAPPRPGSCGARSAGAASAPTNRSFPLAAIRETLHLRSAGSTVSRRANSCDKRSGCALCISISPMLGFPLANLPLLTFDLHSVKLGPKVRSQNVRTARNSAQAGAPDRGPRSAPRAGANALVRRATAPRLRNIYSDGCGARRQGR